MNIFRLVNDKVITVFLCSMITLIAFSSFLSNVEKDDVQKLLSSVNDTEKLEKPENLDSTIELQKDANLTKRIIVYDGMTMIELSDKLNRSLKSTIAGKGELIASYSLERGVDPYIAVGIMLLETGCNGTCSALVRECNNVGGMKGSPGCDGGSYKTFASLDDGIRSFIDNLADNYYAYGLTTPETMNSKYAESSTWAMKVNNYISSIRAK